jgi:MFS family permease
VIVRNEKTTYELPIRKLELIIITGAISAFASLSIDTYLPALPSLEHFFSATSTQVQLTLASFFVAFAMGQVVYGPIIDRFGRKRPLCAALLLYATASAGCALSGSIGTLVMMRFVQALGHAPVESSPGPSCATALTPMRPRAFFRCLFLSLAFRRCWRPSSAATFLSCLAGGRFFGCFP